MEAESDDPYIEAVANLHSSDYQTSTEAVRCLDRLLMPLAARLAWRHRLDVDDCRQVARHAIWEAAPYYNATKGPPTPYLSTVIYRRLQTFAKHNRTSKCRPQNGQYSITLDDDENELRLKDIIPDRRPQNPPELHELLGKLSKLLPTILSRSERTCWILRARGWTYSEIANRLKTNNKSVDNSLARADVKLRFYVSRSEGDNHLDRLESLVELLSDRHEQNLKDMQEKAAECQKNKMTQTQE